MLMHIEEKIRKLRDIKISDLTVQGAIQKFCIYALQMTCFYLRRLTSSKRGLLMECLDMFCASSGQQVSIAKTKVYFSKNFQPSLARSISYSTRLDIFPCTSFPNFTT
jgi:hypothetical protein